LLFVDFVEAAGHVEGGGGVDLFGGVLFFEAFSYLFEEDEGGFEFEAAVG
jgi:hypothetical protein